MDTWRSRFSAAWLTLAACVLTTAVAAGGRTSFAAFLHPIEVDLGLDRATLSLAGSLTVLTYGLGQPFSGAIATRFGARRVMMAGVVLIALSSLGAATATGAWQLYVFAGVLPGLAFALSSSIPGTVLLAQWFDRRLGLVTGLMSSAIPIGQAVFVPLVTLLIPSLGWRGSYVAMGALMVIVGLPALRWLARDPPEPVEREAPRTVRVWAGRDVWLLAVSFFACGFTDQFVTLHLVALGIDRGLDPLLAAGALSALMVVAVIGSALSGPLADAAPPSLILSGIYLLRAVTLPLLLLVGVDSLWPLGAFVLLFGITYISNQAAGARLVRDRYGLAAVGSLMGSVGLAHQVGGAIGVALGGWSVDHTGSYGLAVLVSAGVAVVGGLAPLAMSATSALLSGPSRVRPVRPRA